MEPRISIITLGVEDLERSLRFYRDGLGFPTTWTAEKGVIFFKTQGTCLALYPYPLLAKDVGPQWNAPRGRFSGITLAHNVRTPEEITSVLQQAQAAGGRIEKPAQKAEWGGHNGYFSDPDGYLWEVACGGLPMRDDGSVEIP